MKCKPVVSVIVPTFNTAAYISEAVSSILNQTYSNLEVIVMNDGSTDNTEEVLKQYSDRIHYHYQENAGISSALNHAVTFSRGEFLGFLDADDIWTAEKIERQLEAFEKNPAIEVVFSHIQQFVSPELSVEKKRKLICPKNPMPGYARQTMLVRRRAFDQVGGFSTTFSTGEFMDWYMRSQECEIKSHMLPDVLCKRRIHTANTTLKNKQLGPDYARLLKSALDRRRKGKQL